MYDRSHSPALSWVAGRRAVRQIHWRSVRVPADWRSAHRARQIEARLAQARERHLRLMLQNRGGRF